MTGKPIDGVVQALIEVAVGKVQHLYRGTCPDAIEGFDSRDPQCPACQVLTAAQQGQAVAWADEWRAAVAAKLSSYGLSEEAAAVFASSELDEYKAGLCDCAENDPVDMVDLMMGVARDAIEKWKIESAGRPFGHKNTAPPPSAPVGVEGFEQWYARVDARFWNNWDACNAAFHAGKRAALAQQPEAVVDDTRRIRALADNYWRLEPFDMPTPGGDDADVGWRVIEFHRAEPRERVVVEHYRDNPREAIDAALATQHQEPTT